MRGRKATWNLSSRFSEGESRRGEENIWGETGRKGREERGCGKGRCLQLDARKCVAYDLVQMSYHRSREVHLEYVRGFSLCWILKRDSLTFSLSLSPSFLSLSLFLSLSPLPCLVLIRRRRICRKTVAVAVTRNWPGCERDIRSSLS